MQPNDIINDRYLLVRSIGRGSFGEVWLATDQKLGFNVAIKIYIALDTRGLNEFKNEFKSVYNLHHPNLLRADYFDNVGNNPYLIMPYCPSSVGDKVGKMDESEIWDFIKGVAAGLAYLHSNDIIHRDIKPDNILKDEQGNYVISDFGLSTKMRSTLRKASARQNESSNQSGTIGYMAPEMFSSKPNAVKATDIWALGATIYEIATSEMPFCGQGGIMELHGAELPELPSHFSKELGELMTKCLAKDTWDRPTAQDIVDSLSQKCSEDIGKETVSRETYDYEIDNLKKIIENERNNHKLAIESLENSYGNSESSPKRLKIWLFIMGVIALFAIIYCISLSGEISDLKYQNTSNNDKNRMMSAAFKKVMEDTPLIVRDIEIWNAGENIGDPIYSSNTTFIHHQATFIANDEYSGDSILVKFIAPYGLTQGTNSPRGYSYKQAVLYSPYEMCVSGSDGWGNENKGNWSPGSYRIEYWLNNKCIGSKSFTIK